MTKKARTMRIVVNGVLLAAIVTMGVTVYQSSSERQEAQKEEQQLQEQAKVEESAEDMAVAEDSSEEEASVDAGTSQVEAQLTESRLGDELEWAIDDDAAASELVSAIPEVHFTEDTLMVWPLAGDVIMDYSMENTIYHPTLDQYRCNEGIVVTASVDAPVLAAVNATVLSVAEDPQTGVTVTTDLGNGYQAVYGQLQNVQVTEGQTIGQNAIIGYVAEPTKYYSAEGTNLYFAMSKDGISIDPIVYLP